MMVRAFSLAFSLAMLLPSGTALPQQPAAAPTFSIRGTVVEHGSNRPLRDATVTIDSVQNRGETMSSRTDLDGRFIFTPVLPGKYSLFARKHGFPPQNFQQDEQFSTAVAVGPALDSEHIIFPLSPAASISGTVVDEENEPVAHSQVLLFSQGVSSGAAQVTMHTQRSTNSAGEFRFPELPPGTYFVAVQAHPWYAQASFMQFQPSGTEQKTAEPELDVAYPITYYASVTDPQSASAITVSEGSSTHLQIALRPVPSVHVQITGLRGDPNRGGSAGSVSVTQLGLGGFQSPANAQFASNGGDRFEVSGFAPGRYILSSQIAHGPQTMISADGQATIQSAPESSQPQENLSGVFDLTANQSLDISAFNRISLTGQITFEGNGALPPNSRIILQTPSRSGFMLSIAPDGTLRLQPGSTLLPGRYHLYFQGAQGLYLKSIAAKGATLSGAQLDIPNAASVQLSLVVASGLSSLNGVAMKDDKPFPGAMVLLIPKDFSRVDFICRDQSDSDGTFTLPNVAPGRYTLLAIDKGHDLEYQNPTAMKPYLASGIPLTAPFPNNSPVRVEVLPRQ